MVESVDVSLKYSNGKVKIQIALKILSLHQLKKVPVKDYYLIETKKKNSIQQVELKAKICLPILRVNQISLKKRNGNIGHVSYIFKEDGSLILQTSHTIPKNKVKYSQGKYLISILEDSHSIINIQYSLPSEVYHRTVPSILSKEEEAAAKAQKITDDILSGHYPKEIEMRQHSHKKRTNHKPIQQESRIWIARDTAFKRCNHCINLRADNFCGVHKKKVQSNNACSRFFTPRIYLGGSISPR